VVQLYNDVETERDYDVGLLNVQSQRAHAVIYRGDMGEI